MESTELHDMDFISNPFTSFSEPTFFTPTTSSLSDDMDSPKAHNEDEEDEYITELTRQMTNYMLQDDEKHQKVPPTLFISLLFRFEILSFFYFQSQILINLYSFLFSLVVVVVALARRNRLSGHHLLLVSVVQ